MKITFLTVLVALGFTMVAYSDDALRYEPSVVTLRGTLSLQDFAGPPNFEDIKKGDRLERSWVLILHSPISVNSDADDDFFYAQKNVKEVQLVCSEKCSKQFRFLSEKEATLSGTLFPAHTGHHHKRVLMYVQKRN